MTQAVSRTKSARDAIRLFLARQSRSEPLRILIPAYYGYSPREGSGVWDPLMEFNADIHLYAVDGNLNIDLASFYSRLHEADPDVVMLIHYFGWPDPAAQEVSIAARNHGAAVIEDEAHSLLSHVVGGSTGRFGDASAISVHKSLPRLGGLLVEHHPEGSREWSRIRADEISRAIAIDFQGLFALSHHRRNQAKELLKIIGARRCPFEPLRTSVPDGVVPLNLPIVVPAAMRQDLYVQMNHRGYPVVSLYYQLGPGIDPVAYPTSRDLSSSLINLPLHPESNRFSLLSMVETLVELVNDART